MTTSSPELPICGSLEQNFKSQLYWASGLEIASVCCNTRRAKGKNDCDAMIAVEALKLLREGNYLYLGRMEDDRVDLVFPKYVHAAVGITTWVDL